MLNKRTGFTAATVAVLVTLILTTWAQQRSVAQTPAGGGRYVLATQATQQLGGQNSVLWVMDSFSGSLRAYTLVLATGGAIQYAEIPKTQPSN